MELKDKRNAYKGFFLSNEHGRELMELIIGQMQRNTDEAMKQSSITYLDRAKGNQEILELINNVINTEVTPTE